MSEGGALQELEIKLAFLERANSELSDVVYRQQRVLEAMQQRMQVLEAQLEVLRESVLGGG
jgi:SlyX protein